MFMGKIGYAIHSLGHNARQKDQRCHSSKLRKWRRSFLLRMDLKKRHINVKAGELTIRSTGNPGSELIKVMLLNVSNTLRKSFPTSIYIWLLQRTRKQRSVISKNLLSAATILLVGCGPIVTQYQMTTDPIRTWTTQYSVNFSNDRLSIKTLQITFFGSQI